MRSHILSLCAFSATLISASTAGLGCYDESAFKPEDIIQPDVLVIGGGATGTYAAVRLRDQNKTVTVVEQTPLLGGHVNTLKDPHTGEAIEYGVQAYIQNDQTTQFFGRFNVQLNNSALSPFPSKIVDFKTGFVVPNATAVDPNTLVGPLANYLFATLNFDFLAEGYYDLPKKVPEDLLIPFGQFVQKYNLTDAVQVVWIFANGVGNLLETPTLYVLQDFGQAQINGLATGYEYAPGGNQQVYDRAAAFLGSDVLFSSTVVASKRTDDGVKAVVATPTGRKLIKAKKLLITIPPTVKNLAPFDLNDHEHSIFSQWKNVPYFVGVINDTGLPELTNFDNVDITAPDALPTAPFVWRLEAVAVAGYQVVKVIGEPDSAKAQALVTDAVRKVGASLNSTSATGVNFVAWQEHTDLGLQVSTESIAGGFYGDLYDLQGQRSTLFTGNAWCSDYSPLLWHYTEERVLSHL